MSGAERSVAAIRARSRPGLLHASGVDVHFHPDRRTALGPTVLEALAVDRSWRTQFETGTSNGGLTAHAGGDRWRWESRLFDGAYDDAPSSERPVYGGLRTTGDPYGSAPRFGSAHLRLRAAVLGRTTLCYPDSVFDPEGVGTVDRAGAVIEAMRSPMNDPLDRYVEAHVHGGLRLDDVEAVVLDPSFRGSAVEEAGRATGLEVRWHPGFRLAPDAISALADYRGAAAAEAARVIADGGVLTPATLGATARAHAVDADVLKRVWHLLAAYGRADAPSTGRRRHTPSGVASAVQR